eukprot:gene34107-44070_t
MFSVRLFSKTTKLNFRPGSVENRFASSLAGKSLMSISQLTNSELEHLIGHSISIKKAWSTDAVSARGQRPLLGQTMSMIFQKRSTRTRVSTETGMFLLGGHGLMLGPQDIQLGVNESMKDTALVLSRFNDIILARVFAHKDVQELATFSTVPVINALSDKYHPLQALADIMTLKEHFGQLKGKTVSWVGDGNNVLHDLMIASIKSGMHVRVATPKGYDADEDVIATAKQLAIENGVTLTLTTDPRVAVTGAHVVVTDTWVSMGQEEEAKKRKLDFAGYQVNSDLMGLAQPEAVFLHCLPRKPEEVSDEVSKFVQYYFSATPYKEYVEALRAHFFIPKAKLANLEKVKMIDFRDEANEAANSDTSFGDNKKEFLEMLKSQFFIAKTETEMSRKVKIINSPTEEKENLNSDPGFSNNKNDFKEDNSYTLAVVRNRRKMLRDESDVEVPKEVEQWLTLLTMLVFIIM